MVMRFVGQEIATQQVAWLNGKVAEAYAAWKANDLSARRAIAAEVDAVGLGEEFRVQWIGHMQGMN